MLALVSDGVLREKAIGEWKEHAKHIFHSPMLIEIVISTYLFEWAFWATCLKFS